ncbi:hypothetical protein [Botryobacter ruber]|uniref:hypothetical protein n=1 Tax=Botryobacter ruber TaxID=2171629 RepID=UPI000F64BE75|nr:hypothetical protein [Botryobacter ruber]
MDELVKLDYASAQDVLFVEPQDNGGLSFSKINRVFSSIVACIKEREIKNLLIDFSRNTLAVTETEYKSALARLAVGLTGTTIEKLARIATDDQTREKMIERLEAEIRNVIKSPLQVKDFPNRAEAMQWLME